VLDGAPAICMAVNRRAHVSITSSDKDCHSVSAAGFSDAVGGLDDFPLLDAVWQELQPEVSGYLNIMLDSSTFVVKDAGKIGIGSSAALTVALAAALDRLANNTSDVRRAAMAAHRRLQGGAGSGADIACCLTGGLIEYRMGEDMDLARDWPEGLSYALLWSGVAADTSERLRKLASVDAAESRAELNAASQGVAQAWRGCRTDDIIPALRGYTAVLRTFDVDHELGIFDAGHAELADLATTSELVYKPCGAGGGDLGIVIGSNEAEVATFVESAGEVGFTAMDLGIDATGLVVHSDS